MKFCPHCGKKLQFENAELCPECGCRIAEPRIAMASSFNIVILLILVAILGVLCLIAANSVFSAHATAEKTTFSDTSVSSLANHEDSSLTVVWKTMEDWESWEHMASWSGKAVGPCSEEGPRIVGSHGEYGANVNLVAGSTDSNVRRTFTDSMGDGWNTLTFAGKLSPSDVPWGRWLKIEVNDLVVYQADATQSPPGNAAFFSIPVHFPQSKNVRVKISNGQSPAWGPSFGMEYYSLRLSRENGVGA